MKKCTICLILSMALLAGCATDRGQTQAEGTGAGAVLGAATGALIGYLAGGEKGALIGVASGAAVGAGAGYAVGTHVANQKAKYVKQEDYLDAVIDSARKMNQETRQFNALLGSQIDTLDRETTSLVRLYNQRAVRKVELQKEEQMLAARISQARAQLQKVRNELNVQVKVLTQEKGQSQDQLQKQQAQINELARNKVELEQYINRLASIKSRVAV
jgi:uncharacterized protein YcfJ